MIALIVISILLIILFSAINIYELVERKKKTFDQEVNKLIDPLIDYNSFDFSKSTNESSIEAYFKFINNYVEKAQKSIKIYYYPSNDTKISELSKEKEFVINNYKKYFENLKTISSKRNIEYSRIIFNPDKIYTEDKYIFFSQLFSETINHLNEMLKQSDNNFSLYFSKEWANPYNFMIIDDEILLIEHDKEIQDFCSIPSFILVFKKNSKEGLVEKHIKDINGLIKSEIVTKIETAENFGDFFSEIIASKEKERKKLSEEIKTISIDIVGAKGKGEAYPNLSTKHDEPLGHLARAVYFTHMESGSGRIANVLISKTKRKPTLLSFNKKNKSRLYIAFDKYAQLRKLEDEESKIEKFNVDRSFFDRS